MARYRQVYNEETGKNELIPIDEAAIRRDAGVAIHGPIEPFVSPVDGSVISDRKQLREHNLRNNVVNYHEFDGAEQNRRKAERERLHSGEHTPQEKLARKREIYELINRAERQ
jgi:hypothetical protein